MGGTALWCREEPAAQKALQLLEEFKIFVPVLPMPENAGATYGAIGVSLESGGQPTGNNDLWIAAHAKEASLLGYKV